MRIGIIGGWGDSPRDGFTLFGDEEPFRDFCRQLGRRLGEVGQAIIVGTDAPEAADTYVVGGLIEGAVSTGFLARASTPSSRADSALVHVIRGGDGTTPFAADRARYPSLFTTIRRPVGDRAAAKLIAVQEADAIITIGGFRPTYYAGLGSIFSGRRVVPVPAFGGASRELFEIVDGPDVTQAREDFGRLDGPRDRALVDTVLDLAGVGRLPRVMIIHGHGEDRRRLQEWLAPRAEVVLMIDEIEPGQTLPEKYEHQANRADAAIALATPDDLAALAADPDSVLPRARQNVWFEVGWFWGRLGRSRVLVLRRGGVEIPSDYLGIEFLEYNRDPTEQADKIERFLDAIQRRG